MPNHDTLIDELCATAAPIRRVPPVWQRVAVLVPVMLALGWATATILHRTVTGWAIPDVGIGVANAALSLLLGCATVIRALAMSVAGRSARWGGWVTLALGAWLAVAAVSLGEPLGLTDAYREGRNCFTFILVAGLPMSAVVIAALRRTRSLTPIPSLVTAGFGIAFLSFGLLAFCHPAATTIVDTLGHLAAALVLGLFTTLIGFKAIAA